MAPSPPPDLIQRLIQQEGISDLGNGRLQLELELGLEKVWPNVAMGASFIALALCFGIWEEPDPEPFCLAIAGLLALAGVSLLLRKRTDNFYILDSSEGALFDHRKLFTTRIERVADYANIEAVSVTGSHELGGRSRPNYWTYQVVFVLPGPQLLAVSNAWPHRLDQANALARELASLVGAPFIPGQPERELVWNDSPDTPVAFRPRPVAIGTRIFQAWVLLLLGIVIFGLIGSVAGG